MKRIPTLIIACIAIIASGFTASVLWNVSNEGVSVNFELSALNTKGTFNGLQATIDFDKNNLAASKISASIDVKTIKTDDPNKDNHLLTEKYFNAEKFPTMSFVSTSIKATAKGFLATGNLTIKDSTKKVEMPFSFTENAEGGGTFKGKLSIFSGDFGVTKKSKTGKDKVEVSITVPVKK